MDQRRRRTTTQYCCRRFARCYARRIAEYYPQLVEAYAVHVEEKLDGAIKNRCHGCSVDHPSQTQHDVCCWMGEDEQIEYCLKDCVESLNEREVTNTFVESLDSKKLSRCPRAVYDERCRGLIWTYCPRWTADVSRAVADIRRDKRERRWERRGLPGLEDEGGVERFTSRRGNSDDDADDDVSV